MDKDSFFKEIDLIQSIIERLARNSFLLKGWLITIIGVLLALNKNSLMQPQIAYLYYILIIPILLFWYLDAFFLQTERRYRRLYNWVINNRRNTDEKLFDLDHTRFKNEVGSLINIMFSRTLIPFYVFPLLFLLVLFFLKF